MAGPGTKWAGCGGWQGNLGARFDRGEAAVAATGRPPIHKGAWVSVLLITVGFVLGLLALVLHSAPLWIATGAALVAGAVLALASRIMEQVH